MTLTPEELDELERLAELAHGGPRAVTYDRDGAGRDGDFSFAYIAGMLDSYAACIHEYAPADDFARWHYVPEIQEAATWLRALRPQAQAALTQPEQPEAGRGVCSRCHGVDGDCDALMSDDPTACPCRCHEPQVQEAGRDDCQRCEGYGEIPIEDLDVPCGACKGTGKSAPPANAEAVRLVAAFRGFWVTNESGMLERCVATIDAIEKACRDADTFLAQHGGRDDG